MKTKAEAEATLAKLELRTPVVVTDVATDGAPRREFRYNNPNGLGIVTVEVDADPSDEQLADLARNLPVPEEKRQESLSTLMAAKAELTDENLGSSSQALTGPETPKPMTMTTKAAIGVAIFTGAATAAELAHLAGWF